MQIVDWYTTDTSPILDWRFTLPTNYRCYLDRLSVDLLTDKKTPLDQNVSRYSANTRLTSRSRVVFEVSVGQHSSQYIDQQSPKRYMILHVVIYTRFQKRYIVVSPNSKIFQYWAHTSTSEPCSQYTYLWKLDKNLYNSYNINQNDEFKNACMSIVS